MKIALIFLLSISSVFSIEMSSQDDSEASLQLTIHFEEPQVSIFKTLKDELSLPRWTDAYVAFDSIRGSFIPYYSVPILLPPSGQLPVLRVLSSESVNDRRVNNQNISLQDLLPERSLSFISPTAQILVTPADDFRSYKTARVWVFPYHDAGQRLTDLELELTFDSNGSSTASAESESAVHFVNGKMGSSWALPRQNSLLKSSSLASGTWYKIPITEFGIYRITSASFGSDLPSSDPNSWQVYAPFFQRQSLPFALDHTAPTPDNLKPISSRGTGLDDGQFDAGDEISFFAQALDGDFKGDNFTHLYGTERFYWLSIPTDDSNLANSVTLLPSSTNSPATTVTSYEKRRYHESENTNQLHSGRNWVGEKLTGSSDNFSYFFNEDYLDLSQEIKLNALFIADYGLGYFQHNVNVELNGIPFNTSLNSSAYYRTIGVAGTAGANMLADGSNTLRFYYNSNSANSIVYVDSIRLAYSRYLAPSSDYLFGTIKSVGDSQVTRLVFRDLPANFSCWDISDPAAVKEWDIQSEQFIVEGTQDHEIIGFSPDQIMEAEVLPAPNLGVPVLRDPNRQADYIIITPDLFLGQAERVRLLREEQVPADEQLEVEIVRIQDIYDEFSAGTVDPAAIKHFLHYVYFNWESPRLRYVLLLGDTDYDYRNISGQSKMIIPTFQKDGVSDVGSYATDDKYTFLASGIWDELPDFAIGRYPAQTADQLEIMIDKLVRYVLEPEPGIWQNTITLVADDPLRPSNSIEREHIRDSESLSRIMPRTTHINKIYLTEYPEVNDPNSPYIKKPKAREDFLQKLFNGSLLVNYFGHGSPNVWAQEEVFTVGDLGLVKTGMKLPFWIAGTCDWAKYDDINSSCVPEELMLMESNGAVGILSTTRKTYSYFNNILLSDFFDFLFPESTTSRSITVGEAIMMAKNNPAGSDANNEKYILFSDPALKLASPRRSGSIESVNPTTLSAMGKVAYSGITDTSLTSNARGAVTVYDTPTPVTRSFVVNSSGTMGQISYTLPGKRIFRGLISVDDTNFSGEFTVPKDIKYAGTGGILSVQYWDGSGLNGTIFIDTLQFEGTDLSAIDDEGPEILFVSDNMILLNGDHFSANEILEVELSDDQGINLTGAAGHGISLAIDEDWDNAFLITELFEYDLDHSDKGRLTTYLSEISPGEHLISVKAWDSQNNPGEASVRLEFFAANDFRIYDLFNFPNPMAGQTQISYMLSHDADVSYALYTLAGRKIMGGSRGYQSQGFNSFPWDGLDRYGNQLANGVYILIVEGESSEFEDPSQTLQKIVIAR